jgi:hypothetical protein
MPKKKATKQTPLATRESLLVFTPSSSQSSTLTIKPHNTKVSAKKTDTIGDKKIDPDVHKFVEPNIQYHTESAVTNSLAEKQDTIGAAGYDPKVHAFVRPNIVYQSNDVNYAQKESDQADTIGNKGIAVGVHTFVEPVINTYD